MRKNVFGRQLKRDKNERKALFKSLISSFVLKGKIKTTEAKAKSIKGEIDKLVVKAKKHKLLGAGEYLTFEAFDKLKKIALGFSRNSGYTRLIRLGNRFSDNASLVLMEWTEIPDQKINAKLEKSKDENKKSEKPVKKAAKKQAKTTLKKAKTK